MSDKIVEEAIEARRQRAHTRFSVNWPARIMLSDRSLYQVKVVDVSVGGIGVLFDRLLGKGTALNIEFFVTLSRKKIRIRAKTEVCHNTFLNSGGAKLGLQFVQISNEELETLKTIVQLFTDEQAQI